MTGFRDIQFPVSISFRAVGGLDFVTNVVIVNSGREFRDQVQSQPGGYWEVSRNALLPKDYEPMQSFFMNVIGRAYSFRFKDWTDFVATSAQGKFTAIDGTHFQMIKRYTFGGFDFDRNITKPHATPTITGGSSPSTDLTTGIVTVSSGTPTAWAGEFDCHCRLDTDKMRAEQIDRHGSGGGLIIGWSSIPIVMLKTA